MTDETTGPPRPNRPERRPGGDAVPEAWRGLRADKADAVERVSGEPEAEGDAYAEAYAEPREAPDR